MSKQFRYLAVLCLLICLLLVGCGVEDAKNDNDTTPDDSRVSVPTEGNTDEDTTPTPVDPIPEDTTEADTTRPDYPSDIIIDPDPIFIPEDTETDASDVTDEDSDSSADTDPLPVPEVKVETIKLGEAFLAGDPTAGSLVSKQSDKIQLVVNYHFQRNMDSSVTVDLQVGLECYDVNCGARVDGGKLIVNDEVFTFSTGAIVHEESERIFIPFATYTCQLDAVETSCSIDTSWLFSGVYGGTKIDTLTAGAVLEWGAPSGDSATESVIE